MPKEHLDFDLDFLDKTANSRPAKVQDAHKKEAFNYQVKSAPGSQFKKARPPRTSKTQRRWIFGTLAVFVILLIIVAMSPPDSATTDVGATPTSDVTSVNPTPITDSTNTAVTDSNGQVYECDLVSNAEAQILDPSDASENQINTDKSYIDTLDSKVQMYKSDIDSMSYVTDYSPQSEIDTYNMYTDEYNNSLNSYKTAYSNYSTEIDKYNAAVDKYNTYLKNNCSPQ